MTTNVGTELDALWKIKLQLDNFDFKIKRIEAERKIVKDLYDVQADVLFKLFKHADLDGAIGRNVSATLTKQTVYNIKQPKEFFAYIQKTGDFQLLQRRVNNKQANELFNEGNRVPGLEPFIKVNLKLKGRA